MTALAKKDIINYLGKSSQAKLFAIADKRRREYFKEEVHVRGIIEFSNYCQKDCLYCGLRKSNKSLYRYRMKADEIIGTAISASNLGIKTILLQSGQDTGYSISSLCGIIKKVKSKTGCAVTLSLGEKSLSEYTHLRGAGADRYLLRFETSSRELFKKLKPDSSYENRLACFMMLKSLGFQAGSGMMIGLPGQTHELLAEDILLLQRLCPDMIGIGPFLPHHNTPLAGASPGSLELTLRVLAVIRIMMPDTHIPATTAMGTVKKDGRQMALQCGANVIMPNITPAIYRKHYEIYPNKIGRDEAPSDSYAHVKEMLKLLGRTVSEGYGHSIKKRT
jgi:biotin synthase